MKKLIGYILVWIFYYIGHLSCKITYIQNKKGEFMCDKTKYFSWLFTIFVEIYRTSMHTAFKIQRWAKLEKPWDLNTKL